MTTALLNIYTVASFKRLYKIYFGGLFPAYWKANALGAAFAEDTKRCCLPLGK